MWLPTNIVKQTEELAYFHYVNVIATKQWNEHRRDGELRLLTGWAWTARDGSAHRQGFKTLTVAVRDAYYTLVRKQTAPITRAPVRLRVVASRRVA